MIHVGNGYYCFGGRWVINLFHSLISFVVNDLMIAINLQFFG